MCAVAMDTIYQSSAIIDVLLSWFVQLLWLIISQRKWQSLCGYRIVIFINKFKHCSFFLNFLRLKSDRASVVS